MKLRFDQDFIHEAPDPALDALERGDQRMAGGMEVRRGVAMPRRVAAADVAALQALAQVDPGVAEIEALLAALGAFIPWVGNRIQV